MRRPRIAAGGTRRGLMLWRSALRADCTALLGPGSRRRTRFVRFAHCAQTAAASQMTKRALRARRPRPCAARRHRNRPRRVPPAASPTCGGRADRRRPPLWLQRRVRAGYRAPLRRREGEHGHKRSSGPLVPCERPGLLARRGLQGQDSWPRAQRASSSDSAQLFERSERSERSEFCAGPRGPSIAGEPARSAGRLSEALRPARTRLCRAQAEPQRGNAARIVYARHR